MVFLLVRLPIGPDSCSQSRYLHWLNIEQQITSLWCFCWTWEAIITALSPFPFWHPPVTPGTHTYTSTVHRPVIHTCNGVIRIIRPSTSDMDAHGETWLKWQRDTLQTALTCVQAHNQTAWRWLYFLSDHLRGECLFHPMEGRVDDSGRGRKNAGAGSLVVSSEMKERQNNCNLFRKRKRWGGGSSQGSTVTLYTHPTDSNQRRTFPAMFRGWKGGVTFLFVAIATQDSLSFPSLSHEQMWANTYLWSVFSHRSQ